MTIAFIPVRCGSKGIPLKNIKLFCEKPLVYWTSKAAQDSLNVDKVIIATDCSQIADVVKSFELDKLEVYERSAENAQDGSTTESVMLEYLEVSDLSDDDNFVLLQATSPFTTASHIDDALALYLGSNFDSILSVVENHHFFWNSEGESINYDFNNRKRRQDFRSQFQENGAIYINKIGQIKSTQNRLSGNIGLFKMPKHTALELDDTQDWLIGESIFKQKNLFKKKEDLN